MRRELDFYPTAAWATEALLARVPIRGRVLEPCVGAGDISRVLKMHQNGEGIWVFTNDLDVNREADNHFDARDRSFWSMVRDRYEPAWIVTNPPFCYASEIVPRAVESATKGVAMLLRLTYLEPCEGRAGWLAENPPDKLIVLPRISFTGDGNTDSVTCAWFIWSIEFRASRFFHRGLSGPAIDIVCPPALQPGPMFNEVPS